MSQKKLSRLAIHPEVLKKLNGSGIHNAQDFLDCSELQVMAIADLDFITTQSLFELVSESASPRIHSAAHIFAARLSKIAFLPLRLPSLDHVLGGGLSRGTLSEIVGPAGVGKTQLCLMLTAVTGLAETMGGLGEGTGVLFFDTESKFSAQRLVEIAQAQASSWYGAGTPSDLSPRPSTSDHFEAVDFDGGYGTPEHGIATARVVELLERTHVISVDSSADLLQRLDSLETILIEQRIGLIVIDSIADLVRKDAASKSSSVSHSKRPKHSDSQHESQAHVQSHLISIAATLKKLADIFHLVVLITNQVTGNYQLDGRKGSDDDEINSHSQAPAQLTLISGSSNNLAMFSQTSTPSSIPPSIALGANVVPALGNSWHHCVSTRLVLEQFPTHRTMTISKSPITTKSSCQFEITQAGLVELSGQS